MADLLIAGGVVVTMDPSRRVIEDGAVAVTGDRIAAVGASADLKKQFPNHEVIDASRKAVLPGLIDCHAHAGHGLVKTLGAGDGDVWNEAVGRIYSVGATPEFWHAEARLAALERLKFGTTTGVSYLGGGDDVMRVDAPESGERHCDGVAEIGIRAVVAIGSCRPPFPKTFATLEQGQWHEQPISFDRQIETCETLIKRRHGSADGRVRIALTFPVHHHELPAERQAELDLVKEQGAAFRALSRKHRVGFTQDGHRAGSIARAEGLGLLGPDAFLSHSIDLTAEDIAAAKRTDTRIVHNPSAIMSVRGRCPVPELIEAGVTVALGSDGTAPDRSADMFRHMFQCMHYHRRHFRDARVLPQGKVLEMVTIDAARALGMEKEIGSLEAGKKADLILVDLYKPHLMPLNMPVYRIVSFASGADVDTVIVDGRVLMCGGEVTTVDEREVMDLAQRETERMLERIDGFGLLSPPERFWGHARF
ncbi:MAG: amidohydrolase family protein [Alphaproteobacteria bacterium]|nr:amidohydrolase family protein [Alphaproteobacteria bacterium]